MNTRDNKQQNCNSDQNYSQKSIFDYVTDNSMYINNSQCFNAVPPFVSYIPVGVPNRNIDIENDLRGTTRTITRSSENKYYPESLNTVQTIDNKKQYNLKECDNKQKIIKKYIIENECNKK